MFCNQKFNILVFKGQYVHLDINTLEFLMRNDKKQQFTVGLIDLNNSFTYEINEYELRAHCCCWLVQFSLIKTSFDMLNVQV